MVDHVILSKYGRTQNTVFPVQNKSKICGFQQAEVADPY